MDQPIQIYALRCPRSGEIRYIGKAKDSQKRFKGHLRSARNKSTSHFPVYCWINALAADGLTPTMTVEAIAIGDWRDLEKQMIAQHRTEGARLLNVADGGDMPACSLEQRRLNAEDYNEKLRADPIKAALRRLAVHMGHNIHVTRQQGNEEKAQRFERIAAQIKAAIRANPEQTFYQMAQYPCLRYSMGI